MRGIGNEGEARYFAKPECGVCTGSPLGAPCHEDFGTERLELPALAHADIFCVRALMQTLERTPTKIKKTGTHHSWQLIDASIRLSQVPVYKNSTREWLDLAFGIAHDVKKRPYEGADEQIQSRKILAYEPMFRDQYLAHGANSAIARVETSRRLGHLLHTIDQRAAEYHNYGEMGIARNHSAEIELAYIGLRAGAAIYPASTRQDKSPVKRSNFDLYVHPSQTFTPIQVRNSDDPRTYDPAILSVDYPKFRRDVMSRSSQKERDYFPSVRRVMEEEAEQSRAHSSSKLRPLNNASKLLTYMITAHQKNNKDIAV